MTLTQQILTSGQFGEEAHALEFFDAAVARTDAFRICREVTGTYIQPHHDVDLKRARIDRILIPNSKAVAAGWRDGPIGIECKKSGHKLGRVLSQALDYSRCAWELENGFTIMLRWIFIWPLDNPKGDLESVMAQHRIGYVMSSSHIPLAFGCGGTNGISIYASGLIEAKTLPMGRKVGSR